MYCRNCGAEIRDEADICIHCGVPTHNHKTEKQENPLALIGFILSFFMQLAGLICSIVAYRRCKENPDLEGKTMALAGILVSAISLGLAALLLIVCTVILIIVGTQITPPPEELANIFSMLFV